MWSIQNNNRLKTLPLPFFDHLCPIRRPPRSSSISLSRGQKHCPVGLIRISSKCGSSVHRPNRPVCVFLLKMMGLILILLALLNFSNGYKILIFSPIHGRSHMLAHGRIADELAMAGHDVVSRKFPNSIILVWFDQSKPIEVYLGAIQINLFTVF